MLVPDPKAVRTLLTRYATLRIAQAERESPEIAREARAVGDRLCAMTGAADLDEAIARADALLLASRRAGRADGGLSLAV
ncbi:DUF5133 domain-containing protein [Streptomyces sp. H51]|uniref:DUF5133 domain-containing protein n=1 Tax=Streptomyces sp. H51 TaxID=3111770 RepID=UPI002D798BC8|nr:DUF5133 domain-containing protein [Streptomyces sp. H51]